MSSQDWIAITADCILNENLCKRRYMLESESTNMATGESLKKELKGKGEDMNDMRVICIGETAPQKRRAGKRGVTVPARWTR